MGKQVSNQSVMLDIFTNKIQSVDEDDRIIHYYEKLRIVDDATFIKANEIKESRADLVKSSKKYSSKNLLSNIFYCKDCGASMKRAQRRDKPGTFYYLCSNRHRDKNACSEYHYIKEEAILGYIATEISLVNVMKPSVIRYTYELYIESNLGKDFTDQLPILNSSIEKLEKRKNGLISMRADGEISKEDYSAFKKDIDIELKALVFSKNKITNISREIDTVYQTYNLFVKMIKDFDSKTIDNNELRKIISKITIDTQKDIIITWK